MNHWLPSLALSILCSITILLPPVLFWWIHIQRTAAIILTVLTFLTISHVVSTFSALGHIIMGSSAMGEAPIIPDEALMTPSQLSNILTSEGHIHRLVGTKVNQQYVRNTTNSDDHVDTYITSLKMRHPNLALNADLEERFGKS